MDRIIAETELRLLVVMLAALLVGCSMPVKGYEGPKRPRDQTAHIRAVQSGEGLMEVQLVHVLTSEPIESRITKTYDHTPWMSIPAEESCILVRIRSLDCPSIFEVFSPHNPACVGSGSWSEQEICFVAKGGSTYEIEARTRRNEACFQSQEVTGFWLINTESRETVRAYPRDDLCRP